MKELLFRAVLKVLRIFIAQKERLFAFCLGERRGELMLPSFPYGKEHVV